MKRILLLIFVLTTTTYAQVGIGTVDPEGSSILDISSSDKGILIPRVALTKSTIAAPVVDPIESLLVYNNNLGEDVIPGFYYWSGLSWKALSGGGDIPAPFDLGFSWDLDGNLIDDLDVFGTTNYKPLKFIINDESFGQFHPEGGIAIGAETVASNNNSIAIGHTVDASSGGEAVAFGYQVTASEFRSMAMGANASSTGNSALALGVSTSASGLNSVALGKSASASARNATAVGYGAVATQANTVILGGNVENDIAKVGIGTSTPNVSSVLEISSSDKGLLIPRMALTNTTTAAPVTTPAESLLVYNTNTAGDVIPGFYYWSSDAWKPLTSSDGGGGGGGGGSDSGVKAFGERYYNADATIQMNQYSDVFPSVGVVNSVTSSNITTGGNGLTPNITGVYKVTLTVTYSKEAVNDDINHVDFCIAKNNNVVANTTIRGDLNNDLKRRTLTIIKMLTLQAWQTYHFGILKSGPTGGNVTVPKIILHKDLTNFTIELMN